MNEIGTRRFSLIWLGLCCFALLALAPAQAADLTITPVDPDTPKPKVLWERTFTIPEVAKGRDMLSMPDGGILIALPKAPEGSNNVGLWLIRLDADGNKIWDKLFTASNRVTRIYKLTLINENAILACCDIKAEQGNATYPWIMRISCDGKMVWQYVYINRQCPSSITDFNIDSKGTITFVGVKRCFSGKPYKSVASPLPWVGRMKSNGELLWEKVLTQANLGGFITMLTYDSHFIAGGGFYSEDNTCSVEIVSFSNLGKLNWIQNIGETKPFVNVFLAKQSNSQIVVMLPELPQKEVHLKISNLRKATLSSSGVILNNTYIKSYHWAPKYKFNLVLYSLWQGQDGSLWLFGYINSKNSKKVTNFLTHMSKNEVILADYVIESNANCVAQRVCVYAHNSVFLMFAKTNEDFVRKTTVLKLDMGL